jgi:hypothetical protein
MDWLLIKCGWSPRVSRGPTGAGPYGNPIVKLPISLDRTSRIGYNGTTKSRSPTAREIHQPWALDGKQSDPEARCDHYTSKILSLASEFLLYFRDTTLDL